MLIIRNGDRQTFNDIAKLHRLQFKNYDILSSCNIKLISSYYENISGLDSTILITESVKNQLAGFVYLNIRGPNPIKSFIKENFLRIALNPFCFAQVLKSAVNKLFRPSNYAYENELVYIAVTAEYTGRGIGTGLIKSAEVELKKRMVKEYYLQVLTNNEPAIRLYQKLDFKIVKKLNRFGSDKFIMKKVII